MLASISVSFGTQIINGRNEWAEEENRNHNNHRKMSNRSDPLQYNVRNLYQKIECRQEITEPPIVTNNTTAKICEDN